MDESAADKVVVDSSTASNNGTSIRNTNLIRASYDQDWDWGSDTIEEIIVDRGSTGTLTFSGGWTADSFDVPSGAVDFNGQTVVTTGDFKIHSDGVIAGGATAMDGSDITVGGDFWAVNQDFQATAAYTIAVTGSSAAHNCVFEECDATGSVLWAYHSTDGGNNTNIRFQSLTNVRPVVGLMIGI